MPVVVATSMTHPHEDRSTSWQQCTDVDERRTLSSVLALPAICANGIEFASIQPLLCVALDECVLIIQHAPSQHLAAAQVHTHGSCSSHQVIVLPQSQRHIVLEEEAGHVDLEPLLLSLGGDEGPD